MPRINDTTEYPNTAPALEDSLPGSDASASDATVTFLLSAILALLKQHMTVDLLDDYTGAVMKLGENNADRWIEFAGGDTKFGHVSGDAYILGAGGLRFRYGAGALTAIISGARGVWEFRRGIKEMPDVVTGTTPALVADAGSILTWTLTGNSTPTISLEDGETITLFIDDGSAYVVTWPAAVKWAGGSAPALATTGYTGVVLTAIDGVVYGSGIGDFS